MMSLDEEAHELQGTIFLMATAFRRQRGEFLTNGSLTSDSHPQIAARHMGAAEKILAEGPLTVGALASVLKIEVTTASKIATELEDAGIVQRQRDPEDRRRILLEVVPSEREHVNEFMTDLRSPLVRAIERLTPEELAGFKRGVTLYTAELDAEELVSPPEAPG